MDKGSSLKWVMKSWDLTEADGEGALLNVGRWNNPPLMGVGSRHRDFQCASHLTYESSQNTPTKGPFDRAIKVDLQRRNELAH